MKIAKPNLKWRAMTLRQKTLLIIGATVVGLIAIAFAISQTILMGSYAELERKHCEENVARALNALSDDIAYLDVAAGDWAPWDDTYAFVDDLNQDYIEGNLIDATFINLRLNLMLFVNRSGQLVYGRAFDLQSEQEVPIPHSLEEYLNASDLILNHPSEESNIHGVILLAEGPVLVASQPILTSEHEGPINGTLIMGRYLDSVEVGRLAGTARLSLTLQRLDGPEIPYDFKQASSALSEDTPVFVQPLDKGLIAGYALIEDVYDEPVLMLRVDSPRAIYQQGQASMVYFMAFMFGASVVVGVVALLLMGGLILSPLSRLSSSVSRIGARGDLLARILMTGKDEMSGLASEINGMLDALKQSQEELKRSEEYFRALTENSSDGIVVLNSDGTVRYESPAMERILGRKPEERIHKNPFELAHPDDVSEVAEAFSTLAQTPGSTLHTEVRALHGDGSWHIIEVVCKNLLDNPVVEGIVINARDVTERRQMEEILRQSELLATATIEGMSDGVMLVGMDGRVTYINKAFERLLGYSAGELVGTSAVELPTYSESKDKKKAREALLRVIEKGETEPIDMVGVTKGGTEIPISFSASVIKDAQGNPRTLVAVIRDITERKKAEDALKESEQRFRTIFDSAVDGIVLADPDNRKFYTCNKMFSQMLGYSLEEIKNLEVSDIHPAEDLPYVVEQFEKQVRGEITLASSLPVKRKDGSVFFADINSSVIVAGGKSYMIGTFRDVTERKKAEELLKRSEEYFRTLMDSSLDAITIMGDDGVIRYESPSYERLLGFKPEERVNSNLFERIHPDDIKRVAELFAEFLPNRGGTLHAEVRAQHKDGSWRFIEAMGSNLLDNPIVKGIVVNLRDATERKRMEEALKESEERFRRLVNQAPDIIFRWSPDKGLEYVSPAVAQITGFSPEELMADPLVGLELAKLSDSQLAEDYEKVVSEKRSMRAREVSFVRKDGKPVHLDMRSHAIRDEKGEVVAYEGILRDITERKQMEESVRLSEEKLRKYLESSPDGIYISDLKANFIYGNSAAERLIGYTKAEVIGRSFLDLGALPPEHMLKAAQLLELNAAGKPTGPDEFELIRKDGGRVWVEISTYPIGQGDNTEVIGIARDITERKRMEQQLQSAGRLSAVGELAAGVAHELNNPLAAIQGYSQLLVSRNDLDELTKKDVDTIYREALRASKITKNLLSFARRHEPEKRYISINETVEKTLELRANQMKVNNIELVTELQPDLPNTMADFYQLEQVFMNIAVNAEQAMSEAHGRGRLIVRTENSGDMIQISFHDNGPGISEENLKRIFDPFFTTKDVGKGTGLGLSICYGIIEAHKGRLYARSKLGEGASFFVEIPIVLDGQQA